jgi:hypothetical protein
VTAVYVCWFLPLALAPDIAAVQVPASLGDDDARRILL